MTSSMTARSMMVLSTTVSAFLLMAGLAALTAIARDTMVQPRPTLSAVTFAVSPVTPVTTLMLVPKACVPHLRQELEARVRTMRAASGQGADEVAPAPARQEGGEGGEWAALPSGLPRVLQATLVAAIDRLVALPIIGHYFEGRGGVHRSRRPTITPEERILAYPVTRSPYINCTTGELAEHVRAPREAFHNDVVRLDQHIPELVAYERTTDRTYALVSATIDMSALWDWNTKAIYVYFLLRYSTPLAELNEVVFLDVIVRDVRLPWRLRHLQGGRYDIATPEEYAELQDILQAAEGKLHDPKGATIDHVAKVIKLENAGKYLVEDFSTGSLTAVDVELVMRYQVMSYSGWAPVREMKLGAGGSPMLVYMGPPQGQAVAEGAQ